MTYIVSYFKEHVPSTIADIKLGIIEASKRRVRPCLMTSATTIIALLPVLVSSGRGADVAKAMALPIFGGMFVDLSTLFVVPIVYAAIAKKTIIPAKTGSK